MAFDTLLEILGPLALISVISLICNILTIFVICKHQKLHRNVTNIIILNINIVQTVIFFSSPIILWVIAEYYFNFNVESNSEKLEVVVCILINFEFALIFSLGWFILLLVSDWYFKVYKEGSYSKFCNVYKFFIVSIYLLIIISSFLTTQSCFADHLYLAHYVYVHILLLVSVLLVIFLVILNIVHRCRSITTETYSKHPGLALANIFILVLVPSLLNLIAIINDASNAVLTIVCMIFGLTDPIFSLLYLFFSHNDYNIFFKRLFKLQCNSFENELLQEEEQSVTFSNANGSPTRENCDVVLN